MTHLPPQALTAFGNVLMTIGNTAVRIRLYSSYSPPDHPYALTQHEIRDDLLVLSDALHVLGDLGLVFQQKDLPSIALACDRTISYMEMFISDDAGKYPAAGRFSKIKDFDAVMKRCRHGQWFVPEALADSLRQLKNIVLELH